MRSALDGTQREPIVSEYLNAPNGIAIDYEREIVYWVDGEGDSLEMCDYDGGYTHVLMRDEKEGRKKQARCNKQ